MHGYRLNGLFFVPCLDSNPLDSTEGFYLLQQSTKVCLILYERGRANGVCETRFVDCQGKTKKA